MLSRDIFKRLTRDEQDFFLSRAGFTDRQVKVFELKCRGFGRFFISDKLGMSESCVGDEVLQIKRKMLRCMDIMPQQGERKVINILDKLNEHVREWKTAG